LEPSKTPDPLKPGDPAPDAAAPSPAPEAAAAPAAPEPTPAPAPAGADGAPAPAADAPAAGADAPAPPPLTPMAWVRNNGLLLTIIAAFIVLIVWNVGLGGLFNAFLVALGVGLVIFIHELGHFLAAKWCDVHVLTFSIGFGPAIPGCSFQRGETTYKVAVLPLGGYVHMVGEGSEADEGEDYPRSFKNKSVGQRMLIISAGVIMNVILGAVCFVIVYSHGKESRTADVGHVDAGSPAWEEGIPVGWRIARVGGIDNPTFEDLQYVVALSAHGDEVEFVFEDPNDPSRHERRVLKPRRDANSRTPLVGLSNAPRLKLPKKTEYLDRVVYPHSPAAAARAVDLHPGDVALEATDPRNPDRLTPLTPQKDDKGPLAALCRRMLDLVGKPFRVKVARAGGGEETIDVPPGGFEFEDAIVGCSADPHNLLLVEDLPPKKSDPASHEEPGCDPFEWRRRMNRLAGLPAVVRVQRKGGATVDLLVPPAFHVDFGLVMKMGQVAAVRKESPAFLAGVKQGDVLTGVKMTHRFSRWLSRDAERVWSGTFDPMRLPDEMAAEAKKYPGLPKMVTLTVLRADEAEHKDRPFELPPVRWDDQKGGSDEEPSSMASPLSVAQLGVAYYVMTTVAADPKPGAPAERALHEVPAGSEPDKAGVQLERKDGPAGVGALAVLNLRRDPLRAEDVIEQIRFRTLGKNGAEDWGEWFELNSTRGANAKVYDEWPFVFFQALQDRGAQPVQMRVNRGGKLLDGAFLLTPEVDPTWPRAERGLILDSGKRVIRGDNLMQSMGLGLRDTWRQIVNVYLSARNLLTNRISSKNLGGPIMIAQQAFYIVGNDYFAFLWFLGFLSINLAVINFLPIPILDGGHMVFLIYEGIRRKPASERVREIATYVGLALLALLMLYVFSLDLDRAFNGGRLFGNR
jgi:regulator of sigma E protease